MSKTGVRGGARGRAWVGAATVAAVLLLSGCGGASTGERGGESPSSRAETGASAEKSGTGEIREDLAPLTKRFPLLDTASSATWSSGTLGGDAPGPSIYWIDAVVVLPDADYTALRDQYGADEASTEPELVPDLMDSLPSGPLLRSDDLDAAFSPDEYRTEVYLDDATHSVVLLSLFE